jgi:archaellum component FlaG (FlaF/FlaG flagellin family)
MKKLQQIIIIITYLLISTIFLDFLFIPDIVTANPDNIIKISPAEINVEADEEFAVNIVLSTDTDTNCVAFILSWTGSGRVEFLDAEEGSFYNEHGSTLVLPVQDYDEFSGLNQQFSITLQGSAPAKEGVVAVFHFKAISDGNIEIKFSDLQLVMTSGEQSKPYQLKSESGNVVIGQSESDMPELVIKELSPKWITDDESYKVGFTIKNQGGVDAGSFDVGLYVDGESETVATETVTSLAAGTEYEGNFSNFEVTLSDEEDDLKVCVDIEESIDEGDEDNNCLEDKWPGADLVIADMVISWLQQDETYEISYKVKNAGSKDVAATKTSININGENKYVENCPELEPEETFEVTYGPITVSDNIDIIKICADSDKQVDESNENNNCQQKKWPPDTDGDSTSAETDGESALEITGLSREWIEPGKKYNVNFTLENQSDADASSLTVNLYVDGETEPIASETIDELKQGETYKGNFNDMVIAITDEEDTLKVCIDNGDNCRELTVSSSDTATGNISPLVPETRPPTPGITISWEYIGGIIGLVFLIGLLGFALGRRQNDHGF